MYSRLSILLSTVIKKLHAGYITKSTQANFKIFRLKTTTIKNEVSLASLYPALFIDQPGEIMNGTNQLTYITHFIIVPAHCFYQLLIANL